VCEWGFGDAKEIIFGDLGFSCQFLRDESVGRGERTL
jgi:hypothetical protein